MLAAAGAAAEAHPSATPSVKAVAIKLPAHACRHQTATSPYISDTTKALKEILGLLNFYRRFVLRAAEMLLPLNL